MSLKQGRDLFLPQIKGDWQWAIQSCPGFPSVKRDQDSMLLLYHPLLTMEAFFFFLVKEYKITNTYRVRKNHNIIHISS